MRRPTPNAAQYAGIALGLLGLTVYGSIIPLRYEPMPLERAIERFEAARYYDPTLLGARGDWVVNAVQYAFLSFFAAAALGVDRGRLARLGAAVVVVPLGCLTAWGIEFLQVYFPPRTVSINDLVVEAAGVVAGAIAWLAGGQWATDRVRRFWGMRGMTGLARQAAPIYLAALVVVSLMPFDFVLGGSEIAAKAREGRVRLVPFAGLTGGGMGPWLGLATTAAAFAPLGLLAAWLPLRSAMSGRAVLGIGLGVAATIELLQLLVFSRYFDVTDVPVGTAAVLLGWRAGAALRAPRRADRPGGPLPRGVAEALRGRGPAPWLALVALWAAVLVAAYWQPFRFSTDPVDFVGADADLSDEDTSLFGHRRVSWAPLVDYYWASRYNALDQFLLKAASFAPLGALLALAFGRRERLGSAATLLAALLLGTLIEAGQYFIPERHPGTSDPLFQLVGAWLGFKLTRHVAHALDPDRDSRGATRYRVGDPAGQAPPPRGPRPAARPPRRSAGASGIRPGPTGDALRAWIRSLGGGAGGRLLDRIDRIAREFLALPYGVQLVIIAIAAAVLSVGGTVVASRLGFL